MEVLHYVSTQHISWVKSNRKQLENLSQIKNLWYPESIEELVSLVNAITKKKESFDIIGFSSNTLFLPSYRIDNLICTKKLNKWTEREDNIICECGVAVSTLSKAMIERGYEGFEGLTDLPGTIAAGVYGNAGCRGCSVNSLIESFSLLTPSSEIISFSVEDLGLQYRSTSLKRGTLKGVILQVVLKKVEGDSKKLIKIAEKNHQIRIAQQPSAANNLGTTINGGSVPTIKGRLYKKLDKLVRLFLGTDESRKIFPIILRITGHSKYVPYVYYWNRYMFLDEKSHILFPEYLKFIQGLYSDARLEIEIKS